MQKVAETLDIKPVIIRGEELAAKGFGGIYGVGKAAVHPPALVVLSHLSPVATESIAWVGKGIVYDTGGLSIKTKVRINGNLSVVKPLIVLLSVWRTIGIRELC